MDADLPIRVIGTIHTGLQVSDLEKSLGFYRDLLGFEVTATVSPGSPTSASSSGIPESSSTWHSCASRRPTTFSSYSSTATWHASRSTREQQIQERPTSVSRLTTCGPFTALSGGRRRVRSEPVLVTSGANKGRIAVYAKDPDGIRVELLQPRPVEELD